MLLSYVALIQGFTGFGMLFYFTNLSLMEFQVRYLALFLLFLVTDGFIYLNGSGWRKKNIQLMLELLKSSFLVLHFSCYILNDFPDDAICNIAILCTVRIENDTTLYSNSDQASDLWQQLEMACELESNRQYTVDWGVR